MNNNTTQSNTQTAASLYAARYAKAQDLLNRIASRLAEHQRRQAAAPDNWGYAGDLGRLNQELAYVLAALGDTSAAEAEGLKY
jgi:hypothetical protein